MAKISFKNLILDGGIGYLLIERAGLKAGESVAMLNVTRPDVVSALHADYVASGADVVCTNTFGANSFALRTSLSAVVKAGIKAARAAKPRFVALDVGPLGKVVGGDGLSFDVAVSEFKKIVRAAEDKTDFIYIETMTSLPEMRAAIIACKECSKLPVVASMSFERGGRTFFGTSVETFVLSAEALGVSAIGANCSVGPVEMYDIAKRMTALSSLPVFIKPNAGMPHLVDGKTQYDVSADQFAVAMERIHSLGVNVLGGCCGTTPEYIKNIEHLKNDYIAPVRADYKCRVCSSTESVDFDDFCVIGERINPTGKKRLKLALIEQDFEHIVGLAVQQIAEGAKVLDVNCGLSEINEKNTMLKVVGALQKVVSAPLQIDSSDPKTLEVALRAYHGRAMVNSVNGSEKSLAEVIPVAAKYGAVLVGLTLDENGIPKTVAGRVKIAKRIISAAKKAGINQDDVFIDALTLSEASERGNAMTTLNTVKELHELGIKTVLGVSNISFGMPNREDINAKFLQMAKANGLTSAILNPKFIGLEGSAKAERFLLGEDGAVEDYIAFATSVETKMPASTAELTLYDAILTGQKDAAASIARSLTLTDEKSNITSAYVIPALNEVGKRYEDGRMFLPQLIASADAAKAALDVVEAASTIASSAADNRKRLILASVKGDIHDIGKNIVKSVVANYGYKVIDLGRDVDISKVVNAVRANYPCALGLSALMTTTADNMAKTVAAVRAEFPDMKILVGGAVITEKFATSIGAVYCKDATATVAALSED